MDFAKNNNNNNNDNNNNNNNNNDDDAFVDYDENMNDSVLNSVNFPVRAVFGTDDGELGVVEWSGSELRCVARGSPFALEASESRRIDSIVCRQDAPLIACAARGGLVVLCDADDSCVRTLARLRVPLNIVSSTNRDDDGKHQNNATNGT